MSSRSVATLEPAGRLIYGDARGCVYAAQRKPVAAGRGGCGVIAAMLPIRSQGLAGTAAALNEATNSRRLWTPTFLNTDFR